MGLAEQASRILAAPVLAGVLVEQRGTQATMTNPPGTGRRGPGLAGGHMYLAATDAELVLLSLGSGLLAQRLNGLIVSRVELGMVIAVHLADPAAPQASRGTVDLTVRFLDEDEWPLSVVAGQRATAAELARLLT